MRVHKEMLGRWEKDCRLYIADYGYALDDVTDKAQAWSVAHRLDIPREAYHVGLNDSHIETALKRIFTNVEW